MDLSFQLLQPSDNFFVDKASAHDIFSSEALPGSICYYRCWHFTMPIPGAGRREAEIKLSFRYSQVSGRWVMILNGDIVAIQNTSIGENYLAISFKLFNEVFYIFAHIGIIVGAHEYRLSYGEKVIAEINQSAYAGNDTILPTEVKISSATIHVQSRQSVTLYHILTKSCTGEVVAVERRYSEFVVLDNIIKGLTRNHLAATLPSLPGKVYNPMTNQLEPGFLEGRRLSLEIFLQFIVKNTKVCQYTDVLGFLGLHAITGAPLNSLEYMNEEATDDARISPRGEMV